MKQYTKIEWVNCIKLTKEYRKVYKKIMLLCHCTTQNITGLSTHGPSETDLMFCYDRTIDI